MNKPYLVLCKVCNKNFSVAKRGVKMCKACDIDFGHNEGYIKYSGHFFAIRDTIFARDKHKCQFCRTDKRLAVHHIDTNSHNNDQNNLLTLCIQCHFGLHKNYTHEQLEKYSIWDIRPRKYIRGSSGNRPVWQSARKYDPTIRDVTRLLKALWAKIPSKLVAFHKQQIDELKGLWGGLIIQRENYQ